MAARGARSAGSRGRGRVRYCPAWRGALDQFELFCGTAGKSDCAVRSSRREEGIAEKHRVADLPRHVRRGMARGVRARAVSDPSSSRSPSSSSTSNCRPSTGKWARDRTRRGRYAGSRRFAARDRARTVALDEERQPRHVVGVRMGIDHVVDHQTPLVQIARDRLRGRPRVRALRGSKSRTGSITTAFRRRARLCQCRSASSKNGWMSIAKSLCHEPSDPVDSIPNPTVASMSANARCVALALRRCATAG